MSRKPSDGGQFVQQGDGRAVSEQAQPAPVPIVLTDAQCAKVVSLLSSVINDALPDPGQGKRPADTER